MDQWEYFTTHIEADMNDPMLPSPDVPPGNHSRNSPMAMIPRLNAFGAEGWELVAIHPLRVGGNEDFRYPTGAGGDWGKHYFCAFKRRKFMPSEG